jgi:hypothetical protein
MKRHHVKYEDKAHTLKYNNSFSRKPVKLDLSVFTDLKFGDYIVMEDGQMLGVFTNNLSDFSDDGLHTKENCELFITREPMLKLHQGGGPNGIDPIVNLYSTRKVVSNNGSIIEQGLINYLGEASWINLPDNAKVTRYEASSELNIT